MTPIDWNKLIGVYLPQILALALIWGSVAYLAISAKPIPDPLLDAGFILIGFYFHEVVNSFTTNRS